MRKIVVNKAYGGFGISCEAMVYLIKKKSPLVKKTTVKKYSGEDSIEELRNSLNGKGEFYGKYERINYYSNTLYKDGVIYYEEIEEKDRSHPDLVKVVEKLKEDSFGVSATLKIVEIPDDVKWEITEYDGLEKIEEVHRSW